MTMPDKNLVRKTAACVLALMATVAGATMAQSDGLTPVSLRASAPGSTARYDFGETSLLDEPQIVHTFRLRNDGTTPLTLESLVPSCHCTTALVEPDGALPTLAPGQRASVRMTIVAEPYLTGTLLKSVAVYAKGIADPVATLEIHAVLRPSVVLAPEALDFGTVAAGQPRSLTLTARLDSRLLSGGTPPKIIASDPDIRIDASADSAAGPSRAFTYRVTLERDAALGPVRDLLRFAPTAGDASGLSLADGPTVPVTGQVVGAASAEPTALAFGVVTRGRAAARPLHLEARDASLWDTARIAADSPWLTARLVPSRSAGRTLEVTLSPAAPAGSVQSQIIVALANGQRLRVPVTAYVSTAP